MRGWYYEQSLEYLSWIQTLINDFKYNNVVDTCVDYQQIKKCSILRFSKRGFKDNQLWKGVDLYFWFLWKVVNATIFLQKYVIVLIAPTFENLYPSVVKTAPSFSVVLISSGFMKNSYKYTIIMNLIHHTESPKLKLQNGPTISPIQNAKSPTFEVLYHSSYIKKKRI